MPQRVRHANRGSLLFRTPGPVPFGTCICSSFWDQRHPVSTRHYTSFDIITGLNSFTESDISQNIGFQRASATGVVCQQGTLTPPDIWSCPTLGLASVLMLRPISPELVLFPDFRVSNIPRYFYFYFAYCRNNRKKNLRENETEYIVQYNIHCITHGNLGDIGTQYCI